MKGRQELPSMLELCQTFKKSREAMWGLTDRSEPCYDLKQTNSPTQVDNKAMLRFSRYHCRNNILGTAQISFPRKDQMLNRPTSPEMTSKPKEEMQMPQLISIIS